MILTEKQLYIVEKILNIIELSNSYEGYEDAVEVWYDAQVFVNDLIGDLDLELLTEKQLYIVDKIKDYIFLGDDADINEVDIWYEGLIFVKDLLIDFEEKGILK